MSRTKTKRIKALKEFIELEKLNKEPVQEYIDQAEEEIAKLEAYLKKEHQTVLLLRLYYSVK